MGKKKRSKRKAGSRKKSLLEQIRTITEIDTADVYPDLDQPRKYFDLDELMKLANNIVEIGLLKPILVEKVTQSRQRKNPHLENMFALFDDSTAETYQKINGRQRDQTKGAKYWIVFGERRFQAHWRGRINPIRARVVNKLTPSERLALQIAEDSQVAIPKYEVWEKIVQVYHLLVDLAVKEGADRNDVHIPFTELGYIFGRSELEVNRAFTFCSAHLRIRQAVAKGEFDETKAAIIGKVNNPEEQLRLLGIATRKRKKKITLKELEEIVDESFMGDNRFLTEDTLEEIHEYFEDGNSMKVIVDYYNEVAMSQIRQVMGLEKHKKKRYLLSPHVVAWLRKETKHLGRKKKREKELFFRRHQFEFNRRINREIEEQRFDFDSSRTRKPPQKNFDQTSQFYSEQRRSFYSVLNKVYSSLTIFCALADIDPKILKMAKKNPDFKQALSVFKKGLDLFGENITKEHIEKKSERTGRVYARNGIALSTKDYDPSRIKESKLVHLPVSKLYPDPENVRRTFDQQKLEELALSIEAQGIVEPLYVEKTGKKYKVVAGNRRYKAGKIANIKMAPCIRVDHLSPVERIIIQIGEDSQKPFKPSERAGKLFQLYKAMNLQRAEAGEKLLSVKEFAQHVGKPESMVRRDFAFLAAPEKVRQLHEMGVISRSIVEETGSYGFRVSGVTRDFSFDDPDEQVYVSAEELLYRDGNPFEEEQYLLALRAAAGKKTRDQIRKMMKTYNSSNGVQGGLLGNAQEKLDRENERRRVVVDLGDYLKMFKGNLADVLRKVAQSDPEEVQARVYNYPLMVKKYYLVKKAFEELERLTT